MKTAIIIIIISVALLATGILYGERPHRDRVKTFTLEEAYTDESPEHMPDVVIEPMNSFPAY